MDGRYARAGAIVLRLAAAFALAYPALDAYADPSSWIGYFPPFVLSLAHALGVPELAVLHTFGAVEVIMALWFVSGWRIVWPALAATGMLAAIVAFNVPQFQILFRDVAIAGMTLALAIVNWPRRAGGDILPS